MNRQQFQQLADAVCVPPAGVDRVTLAYGSEQSDFIRFNQARVRQATHVIQHHGTVAVIAGQRRIEGSLALTGDPARDAEALAAERDAIAGQLRMAPEDPHLMLPETVASTAHEARGALPSAEEVIAAVAQHAAGTDFVGFYAGGPMARAFADSRGQRNWHQVESFHFEWCLYREADQAVKTSYAGTAWDAATFAHRMEVARERLALLALPRKTLQPGQYRAFFSPMATADLLGILGWGGLGLRGIKTGVGSLVQLHRGEAQMSPQVTITEDTTGGIAPGFQSDGFVKPDAVPLVDRGMAVGMLVSPRSAREYGAQANGANTYESPEALSIAPGTLPESEALQALGTGVYVSDTHYLNYSDRQACRITGMTRFACFWVEDGRIAAPIAVMRFDDSLLRMFGSGLVALTREAELVPESGTYESRQLRSITAPGALVEGFTFTL